MEERYDTPIGEKPVQDCILRVPCTECKKIYEYPCTWVQMARYRGGEDAATVFPDLPSRDTDFLRTFICLRCFIRIPCGGTA
jgi:hypothetical protein